MSREAWEPLEYEGWTFAGWSVRLPEGGTITASVEVMLREEWKPHARPVYTRNETYGAPPEQWCPVCKHYHWPVGEKTDAGALVKPCPDLPVSDPRNNP